MKKPIVTLTIGLLLILPGYGQIGDAWAGPALEEVGSSVPADPISHSEEGLMIWPIPVKEELHILCKECSSGNLPFEIVSMTGRVILRGSLVGGSENMIELEGGAAGDHVLRVVDGRSVRSIAFQRQL